MDLDLPVLSVPDPARVRSEKRARKRQPWEDDVEYVSWYREFPRHCAPADGHKAWVQTADRRPPLDEMLRRLGAQRRLDFDKRPHDRIPYPATYLRGEQWNNQPLEERRAIPRPVHDPHCRFHRNGQNTGKKAPSSVALGLCPECKHVHLATRDNDWPSEPVPIGELVEGV